MTQPFVFTGEFAFWRLEKVVEVTGLSKTEIYRRASPEDPNPFPKSRSYKGDPHKKKGVYWLSPEVRQWQLRECDMAPAAKLSADLTELIG